MVFVIRPLFLSYCLLILCSADEAHPDRVFNLPGAPAEPSFPLYAGYLELSIQDTIHSKQKVFYVLCEAIRIDPLEAPLVVWLNGGPGGSSLMGLLTEHGPYLLEAGKLRYNDLSWNQYANVLYIETPTEVGFSHTMFLVNGSYIELGRSSLYNDDLTANLNVNVLHDFMTRKHPRYASRDFYITGQSYAGFYVPYFSRAILNRIKTGEFNNSNFRGIAMGNALFDYESSYVVKAVQMFAMGLIPEKHGNDVLNLWQNDPYTFHPDLPHFETFELLAENKQIYNTRLICEEKEWSEEEWHISSPTKESECDRKTDMQTYLNRPDVQKSLHAIYSNDTQREWLATNYRIFYTYNDRQRADSSKFDSFKPTRIVFREIFDMANDDFRILYYTGDFDLQCAALHVALGAALIAEKNDFEEVETTSKIWTHLGDLAGSQTSYRSKSSNITMDVLTVRGSGHNVPISQPSRAFQMFNNFISSSGSQIDYKKKIQRRN